MVSFQMDSGMAPYKVRSRSSRSPQFYPFHETCKLHAVIGIVRGNHTGILDSGIYLVLVMNFSIYYHFTRQCVSDFKTSYEARVAIFIVVYIM